MTKKFETPETIKEQTFSDLIALSIDQSRHISMLIKMCNDYKHAYDALLNEHRRLDEENDRLWNFVQFARDNCVNTQSVFNRAGELQNGEL